MAERAQRGAVPRAGPPRRNPPAGDDRTPSAFRQPPADSGGDRRRIDYPGCDCRAHTGDMASGTVPAADWHADRVTDAVGDADAEPDVYADGYLYADRYGDGD